MSGVIIIGDIIEPEC